MVSNGSIKVHRIPRYDLLYFKVMPFLTSSPNKNRYLVKLLIYFINLTPICLSFQAFIASNNRTYASGTFYCNELPRPIQNGIGPRIKLNFLLFNCSFTYFFKSLYSYNKLSIGSLSKRSNISSRSNLIGLGLL